jgi:hypothetical protein
MLLWTAVFLPMLAGAQVRYQQVRFEIDLNPDGSADVLQEEVLDFRCPVTSVSFIISKRGVADVQLIGIWRKTRDGWQELETLEVTSTAQSLRADWKCAPASGGKGFRLDYVLEGAVKRYQDLAEFSWRALEASNTEDASFTLEVYSPQPAPDVFKARVVQTEGKWAWAQRTSHRRDRIAVPGGLVSLREPLYVQVLASADAFPQTPLHTGVRPAGTPRPVTYQKPPDWLADVNPRVFLAFGLILILLPFALGVAGRIAFSGEPNTGYTARYERGPPRAVPPVVVPAILRPKARPADSPRFMFDGVLATLFDLVHRGRVTMQEVRDISGRHVHFTLRQPDRIGELDPLTQDVVRLLFREMTGGDPTLTDADVTKYVGTNAAGLRAGLAVFAEKAVAWWQQELGVKSLVRPAVRHPFVFSFSCLIVMITGLSMLGWGIVLPGAFGPSRGLLPYLLYVLLASPLFAPLLGPLLGGGALAASLLFVFRGLYRWNRVAVIEHKRWHAFRRFLTDFSALKDAPVGLLPVWEEYYVYATALGVTQDFMSNFSGLMIAGEIEARLAGKPAWFSEFSYALAEALDQLRTAKAMRSGTRPESPRDEVGASSHHEGKK